MIEEVYSFNHLFPHCGTSKSNSTKYLEGGIGAAEREITKNRKMKRKIDFIFFLILREFDENSTKEKEVEECLFC